MSQGADSSRLGGGEYWAGSETGYKNVRKALSSNASVITDCLQFEKFLGFLFALRDFLVEHAFVMTKISSWRLFARKRKITIKNKTE